MKNGILRPLCYTMLLLVTITASWASQEKYVFPTNLALMLSPLKPSGKGALPNIRASLVSKLGTLSHLQVFIESSPDLAVGPVSQTFDRLRQSAEKSFEVKVTRGSGKPDEMGSWVRLRVKYLPDHEAIRKIIDNPASYPYAMERTRLLEILEKNSRNKAVHTDVVRFFLP